MHVSLQVGYANRIPAAVFVLTTALMDMAFIESVKEPETRPAFARVFALADAVRQEFSSRPVMVRSGKKDRDPA
jgi:hypothetical protein